MSYQRPVAQVPLPLRFVREVGVRLALRRYWDGSCPAYGYHNASVHLSDVLIDGCEQGGQLDESSSYLRGPVPAHDDPRWPVTCSGCPAPVPDTAHRQLWHQRLYDTPDGELHPGDAYLTSAYHDHDNRCPTWSNCTGTHFVVVTPDGSPWDVDSRAGNCTQSSDRLHRCWVRHGDPPRVTVNKAGHTCTAGAGSIQTPRWHGFLRDGVLVAV